MLESMTILLACFGMAFTVLMLLVDRKQFQSLIFGMFATILWFITAASVIAIDIPYTHLYENVVDNSYEVVEGLYTTTAATPLRFLFTGLGFICLAYTIIMALALFIEVWPKRGEE